MSIAIIGFGKVGQAIAGAFARTGLEVAVASRRRPEELAPTAAAIGPAVLATSLPDALERDTVILAVPFREHAQVAAVPASWRGKVVIDATNAFGVPPEELDDRPSTAAVARAFAGARLVKAFNHLPAALLAADPNVEGGRRVLFLSSDDEEAAAQVATLTERLGYAPVHLGRIGEGGLLIQARGQVWAPLIFQDLVKFG